MALNLITWAQGKKTYIAVGVGLIEGVIAAAHDNGLTTFNVPWYVMIGTGLLGMAALRNGVSKQTEQALDVLIPVVLGILKDIKMVPSAEAAAKQAAQSPEYSAASEQQKTDILNDSQLRTGEAGHSQ